MATIFTRILSLDMPPSVAADPATGASVAFEICMKADGVIPFPQIIVRATDGPHLFNGDRIRTLPGHVYAATIPNGALTEGAYAVQAEGCRRADWQSATGEDWVKCLGTVTVSRPRHADPVASVQYVKDRSGVVLRFGIHKHMHQPYYRAADPQFWDGELDGIFGRRTGAYTHYLPDAAWQYVKGGLPHAGLSTSWSGTLIEQLNRAGAEGLCGGAFGGWNTSLRSISAEKTAAGGRPVAFTAFGHFHPLMPLIPARDIVKQIQWHRRAVNDAVGVDPAQTLFPPETAFHVRMIPALQQAGVRAVIYDSIHRFRATKGYPYGGFGEGMLPPNPAEQENPSVNDWLQLNNIWAASRISPSLLRPEYIKYEDVDGSVHSIIGVPAERYLGNEDARGGYGALQYESVLGQVYDRIVETGTYDPKHPPFFLLHSDGDNYGGGADSYYHHNTGGLVQWLQHDRRFELTTIDDYLQRFAPDPAQAIHVEPGAWSGADNGDPQFRKWFSRYDQPYSPDLNSWAVLTALENAVHTLEDSCVASDAVHRAERLMLTAQTSCYWYWTGQDVWDSQVTQAANAALFCVKDDLERVVKAKRDRTGPTIFAPWVTPENPGGKTWGQGCLKDAAKCGTVHTFVHDISGLARVSIVTRIAGVERRAKMVSHGAYPSHTSPIATSTYYTTELPEGAGDVRYFIEAEDNAGNVSRGALERVHCA
jgi:hypothetical protein